MTWPASLAGGKGLGSALCGFRARSRQDQYLLSDAESEVLRQEPFDSAQPVPAQLGNTLKKVLSSGPPVNTHWPRLGRSGFLSGNTKPSMNH